jgi:hypothetical protein
VKHRLPLLKRAALHALKVLLLRHPRAALSAAGAGAAYAVKEAVQEGAEAVGDTMQHLEQKVGGLAAQPAEPPGRAPLSEAEREQFLQSLSPQDRAELARLAERGRD